MVVPQLSELPSKQFPACRDRDICAEFQHDAGVDELDALGFGHPCKTCSNRLAALGL